MPSLASRLDRVVVPWSAGPQHLSLGVAQICRIHCSDRLHRNQRRHLQAGGSGSCPSARRRGRVARPVLQRELLIEHNVHTVDVLIAPHRFEQAVREAGTPSRFSTVERPRK